MALLQVYKRRKRNRSCNQSRFGNLRNRSFLSTLIFESVCFLAIPLLRSFRFESHSLLSDRMF